MSRCEGSSWIKLVFNRAFTNLLGVYGSDIMLSILKYKNEKLDTRDSQGVIWKRMAPAMYYLSKVFAWAVFCDPYSGIYQTRYKTNCIHLAESFRGEGYCEMWVSARNKLETCDAEALGTIPELTGRSNKESEYVETIKVRSANFMLRYSKVGLHTDSYYYPNDNRHGPETCVASVLLYTSQGNNSGGLFHELYGPVRATRSEVVELLVLMKLLSNDGFVVDQKPPVKESLLTCLSFRDTLDAILVGDSRVNFAMRTGMSFG